MSKAKHKSSKRSEGKLMDEVFRAGKKPDAAQFSEALDALRSARLLSSVNIQIIQKWIETDFPSSIKYLAREILKGKESGDEKEREEKIPSWDARNICSGDTQNDLTGDEMPRDLKEVVSFLLPKGGKSECLTESDLGMIVKPKGNDQVYLYDPKTKGVVKSVLIYRLPSSGIWILGSAPYLRMLKAYQLESFGKHVISSRVHEVGSIWRQEHELFLVKPLHYEDFKALIVNNIKLPSVPAACSCLFKPKVEDWSETFRSNYPIDECEWLIPTWNGFPIALGKKCGEMLHWNYEKMAPIADEELDEELDEESDEESGPAPLEASANAKRIINGFWNIINSKLTFFGDIEGDNLLFTVDSGFHAILDVYFDDMNGERKKMKIYKSEIITMEGRLDMIEQLARFLRDSNDFVVDFTINIGALSPAVYDGQPVQNIGTDSGSLPSYDELEMHKDGDNWILDVNGATIVYRYRENNSSNVESVDEVSSPEAKSDESIPTMTARNIVTGFWNVAINGLSLYDGAGNFQFSASSLPMDASLVSASGITLFDTSHVDTAQKMTNVIESLVDNFVSNPSIKIRIRPIPSVPRESIKRVKINSTRLNSYNSFEISEDWVITLNDVVFNLPRTYIPPSFRTGMDIVRWMREILASKKLVDYRSRNRMEIVPDSAHIIRMRLVLNWSGELTRAVTPSTLEDEYKQIAEYDSTAHLRTAELRIAASSLQDAVPGAVFVVRPWDSGYITEDGRLIMNWSASDLSEQSENEGSATESEGEEEESE